MQSQRKFNSNQNRAFKRKMYHGHWTCADCGKEITELPFQPSPDRPVYCRECHAKRRAQRFRR
ncbi:hypothetical protein J7K44_03200 [bacterium]|nr:hypothetical protein [bacterium]